MIFRRYVDGPRITREMLPPIGLPDGGVLRDPSSVFNPGAIGRDGEALLLLRVQSRGRHTHLVPMRIGRDRRRTVADRATLCEDLGPIEQRTGPILHLYDPRLTDLEGTLHVVTAADTAAGCRLLIWTAAGGDDGFAGLSRLAPAGSLGGRDTRNGVLFPERIGGRHALLHRPNEAGGAGDPASGSGIVLSYSDDLESWDEGAAVMRGRPARWDERIGSGPPPLRVREGWLHLYHGVATHFASVNVYQAGVAILDADDPSRVIARGTDNVLEPRERYELTGQVPNVVFPSGWTVSGLDPDGVAPPEARLQVYYGAADTCVGLAETTVEDLVAAAFR